MLQKSLLDATEKERQESLEYKNCLLDATEKSKTIQQYGMLVLSTFFSFLIYFHLLEMIVT